MSATLYDVYEAWRNINYVSFASIIMPDDDLSRISFFEKLYSYVKAKLDELNKASEVKTYLDNLTSIYNDIESRKTKVKCNEPVDYRLHLDYKKFSLTLYDIVVRVPELFPYASSEDVEKFKTCVLSLQDPMSSSIVYSSYMNKIKDCYRYLLVAPDPFEICDKLPEEFYLLDRWDWNTAKQLIVPRTKIMVDFGCNTIPGDELRKILQDKPVTFCILLDTQTYYDGDPGSFYDVFYTSEKVGCPGNPLSYKIVVDKLYQHFKDVLIDGWRLPTVYDYGSYIYDKKSECIKWAVATTEEHVAYSVLTYIGILVEWPWDGLWCCVWTGSAWNCDIAYDIFTKYMLWICAKRVIWISGVETDTPDAHPYPTFDQFVQDWCNRNGVAFYDLRTEA